MSLFRRLLYWLGSRRADADLHDELTFHREMTRERLVARGAAAGDADRASRRALGNTTLAIEDARAVWASRLADDLLRDTRHALRLVRRQPGFSALTILTLAIGIGAVTTVVSILRAEVWRPLPFPAAADLVYVASATADLPDRLGNLTLAEFDAIRSRSRLLAGVTGFRWTGSRVVTGEPGAERALVGQVTTNFFDVLQIAPAAGRVFHLDDERAGANDVAIVSFDFWQRYFQGRHDVLQQTVTIDNQPFAIIGIAPEGLRLEFTTDPQIFLPIRDVTSGEATINAVGRRLSGLTYAEVDGELRSIVEATLDANGRARGRHVRARDLNESTRAATWRTYVVFMAAAGVLLFAACANVANLLLGRGVARRPEFSLRAALGSGRGRLVRQLIVESLVVAGAAAMTGLALAAFGIRAFVALAPPSYVTTGRVIGIDAGVALFAIALAAVTAAVCGVLPARQASHGDLRGALATAARRLGGEPGQRRLRSGLLAFQVTLAFLLLASAGVLTNSFARLSQVPLGFSPENLWTFRALLRGDQYATPEQLHAAHSALAARMSGIPGVTGVALASGTPLAGGDWRPFVLAGQPVPTNSEPPSGSMHVVSPTYFSLLGTRRLAGRDFTESDHAGSPRVAVVNVNFARRYFEDRDPVGQRVTILEGGTLPAIPAGDVEIVGVVETAREVGIDEVTFECIYVPLAQNPVAGLHVLAKVSPNGSGWLESFRQTLRAFDANVPMFGALPMDQRVAAAYRSDRFNFLLVSGVALLAVALAAIGVYGATAYDTARRIAEFGLRIALGATPVSILRLAISRSVALTAIGVASGLVIAVIAARLIGDAVYLVRGKHVGVVYQVSLTDPVTLAAVCALFAGFATFAAWIPARRATRIDPLAALRE